MRKGPLPCQTELTLGLTLFTTLSSSNEVIGDSGWGWADANVSVLGF